MRILTFNHSGDVVPSITQGRIDALRELGHEVECIDLDPLSLKSRDDYARLVARIRAFGPALALFYGYLGLLSVVDETGRAVPVLEKLGVPYACLVTNLGSFQAQALQQIRAYTGLPLMNLFICDDDYVFLFRQMGFRNVFPLDLATCPRQFFPVAEAPEPVQRALYPKIESYRSDVGFCGNSGNPNHVAARFAAGPKDAEIDFLVSEASNFLYRRSVLTAVRRGKVNWFGRVANPGEYGPNFSLRGWIDARELNAVYNASRIVFNLTHPDIHASIPTRVYDAMACGALVVTDYRPKTARCFEHGREIVFFHDPQELDGLLERYLSDEKLRREITQNARAKVLSAHTWKHRMQELIENMRTRYKL